MVSILCVGAKAAGKPYTKRLLPDFFIPRCLIRLDYLVESVRDDRCAGDVEAKCRALGCVDARTADKHQRRLQAAVQAVVIELARRRVMRPELGELPDTDPETPPPAHLDALWMSEGEATLRAGAGEVPLSIRQMLQASLRKQPRKKPSTFACSSSRPP